jgi:hypothetical protein
MLIAGSEIVAPQLSNLLFYLEAMLLDVNDIVCAHDNSSGRRDIPLEKKKKLNKSSCPSVTILAARAPAAAPAS